MAYVFLLIRHVSFLVIILVLFIYYTSTNSASTRPRTDQTPLAERLTGLRLWSRADSHRSAAAVLWRAHHRTGLVQCRADRLHPEGDGLQGQDDPVHHPPAEQQSLLHVRPAHVPLRGTPGLHGLHRQCSQVLLQVSQEGKGRLAMLPHVSVMAFDDAVICELVWHFVAEPRIYRWAYFSVVFWFRANRSNCELST